MIRIKNPREENGPNGYPIKNEAFERAVKTIFLQHRKDAVDAEEFLKLLGEYSK